MLFFFFFFFFFRPFRPFRPPPFSLVLSLRFDLFSVDEIRIDCNTSDTVKKAHFSQRVTRLKRF